MNNEKAEAEATVTLSKETDETTAEQVLTEGYRYKKPRFRAFPLWLRVLVFIVVLVAVTFAGLSVGYSLLGGGDAADVFKMETWTHIFDIMNGKE